jgi:RNA polymerase sigma-70 factor, ECF subfamily
MSDTSATLLKRLGDRGDQDAWRRLVELYTPLISSWLRRQGVSADDAEDLTQEVLAAVVRHVAAFRHNGRAGAFRTWLRTITANCLRQSWRSRGRHPQEASLPDLDSALDLLEDPASDLARRWDREHDEHVLQQLLVLIEPEFKRATWLAFQRQVIDGMPADAVAAELGMTVNAVLIAKSRVLRQLRRNADGLVD